MKILGRDELERAKEMKATDTSDPRAITESERYTEALEVTVEVMAEEMRFWRRAAHEAGAPECDPTDDRYAMATERFEKLDVVGWFKK